MPVHDELLGEKAMGSRLGFAIRAYSWPQVATRVYQMPQADDQLPGSASRGKEAELCLSCGFKVGFHVRVSVGVQVRVQLQVIIGELAPANR